MRDSIAQFIGRRISAQRRVARFSQRDLGAMAKLIGECDHLPWRRRYRMMVVSK